MFGRYPSLTGRVDKKRGEGGGGGEYTFLGDSNSEIVRSHSFEQKEINAVFFIYAYTAFWRFSWFDRTVTA